MWSFLSRRYMRPIGRVGAAERTLGIVILLFTGGIAAAFVVQMMSGRTSAADSTPVSDHLPTAVTPFPTAAVPEAGDEFPDPDMLGWRAPKRVDLYTSENLYVKINGRAPAYFDAGFVALRFGRYMSDVDARRAIDVYWYDMGRGENAAAMFRAEAVPGATVVSIGDEAYQVGGAVFFRQRTAYVHVLPTESGESDAQAARHIAEQMADFVGRDGSGGRSKESAAGE